MINFKGFYNIKDASNYSLEFQKIFIDYLLIPILNLIYIMLLINFIKFWHIPHDFLHKNFYILLKFSHIFLWQPGNLPFYLKSKNNFN